MSSFIRTQASSAFYITSCTQYVLIKKFHWQDILDTCKFWEEELRLANKGKLFGCVFSSPKGDNITGLMADHSYSVLRAVEYEDKRFIVLRNPWGNSEWTGPWSDGSKEWKASIVDGMLKALGHEFGDDGQFVMECQSFSQAACVLRLLI